MGSMQDLLRVLPSKVIKAARNGSYPAIEALSWDPLELVPDVHRPELVVLFCAHIRKTPRGPGNHDLIQQCFVGLNLLLQLPELCRIPDVLETLPTMVQWFFHSVHELDRGRGSPQLLEAYMYIIYYLVNNSELWPRVLKTPGIIEVGTAMWMRSTVCTVPEYPGAAMGFAELLVHVPDPIIDFLTASVADVGDVAVRLVFPLRVALAAHATTEHLQAYVWQLDQFSQQIPAAPFAPALLSIGAVRLVSRTLLRFSQRDMREHDSLFIVRKCLCMVHRFVEMGTGIPWVAQSVRSGLLAALASIGPQLNLLDADAQVACMALVQDVLPRYLIFRPVIKAVGKVLEKLEDGPHIGLTQSRDFADSWAALKDLAKIRVEYQESEAMMDCSSCLRRGHKSEFRRCARCRQEHYCSVACQVVHWRHEHKAHCRQWRRIAGQLDDHLSIHEQHFHIRWLWSHAEPLATSISALRLAPFSPVESQYLDSLCVVLDCTVNPVQLRMRRLVEHESGRDMTAAEGVLVESNVVLGLDVVRIETSMSHASLVQAQATMEDYVLDRVPVENGGRGLYDM